LDQSIRTCRTILIHPTKPKLRTKPTYQTPRYRQLLRSSRTIQTKTKHRSSQTFRSPQARSSHSSPTVLKVPTIYQKFSVDKRTVEAYATQGKDFESAARDSAYHTVAKLEDDLLVDGWAADGVTNDCNGLYDAANNTEATSSVTSTYGNMVIKMNLAMAVLEADSAADWSFNLVLAAGNYWEVINSVSTTGQREAPLVEEILSAGGTGRGSIMKSADLTANAGMLVPIDPAGESIDLVILSDVHTEPKAKEYPSEDPEFLVIEELVPRIKRTDAICTLTGL
jgi:uncharacterized linocin/CFP29 family protein